MAEATTDLRSRIEVTKLARELDVDEAELAYLGASPAAELRELRRVTGEALFRRHETRVRLLASVSGVLPLGVTAKIAEGAMGAALSARIAGVMEPDAAARLVGHVSPDFLTELAVRLDPSRVGPIVALLPDDVLLDVARRLLRDGELITLARFVAVVDPEIVVRVAGEATGADLLRMALYTEDEAALATLARRLPEATLADLVGAAEDPEEREVALALLDTLDPDVRERVLARR